ncbi:MAG: SDR family NAD(P)-dependent oxidoreductase, partial [Desulfuromonadaceae bacterium]|nr:SDR family NAD(P)-dependent oxidoreductase [Desulfuromonadaceae bacterium]
GLFRAVRRLSMKGCEVFGEVEITGEASRRFVLHPALLDGCMTLAGALIIYGEEPLPDTVVFVPAAIESFTFTGTPATSLLVRCIQRERNQVTARYDLFATDREGTPVLKITGLTLRRIRKEQLAAEQQGSISNLFYRHTWRERRLADASTPLSGRWLVLTGDTPFCEAVCGAIRGGGAELTLVMAATGRESGDTAVDTSSFENLLGILEAEQSAASPISGVISLTGSDVRANLNLARALQAARIKTRLYLVSCAAHDPAGMERELHPGESALWGLGASVAAEAPELSCTMMDLSPWPGSEELAALLRELAASDVEERIALRGGRRFVARLVREGAEAVTESLSLPEEEGFHLDLDERGSLENIRIKISPRRPPVAGEVELRVHAAGLNFRDLLNVLGSYPGDPGIPGFECSGEVVAVGQGIDGFSPGDRVFVFNTDGCIADYLTVSLPHVVRIPDLWRFEEAAAIPVAFLTAWYGLHYCAGIKQGDRVLIHAAAGGVGLAAVQLALAAGAEIFATAGTAEKRELLQQMGVNHLLDSRSLAFADQIRGVTEGRGVDIVLNSLAGVFIDASIGLLAAGGRFIEIGKADSRSDREIGAFYPQISYHRFDLAAVSEQNPLLVSNMFSSLFTLFEQGTLRPLPMTVFQMQSAKDAFRFMAQARHIGKVVISLADRIRERSIAERGIVDPNASYLITGGFGALGMAVAVWFAGEGCRHLALVGRNAPSPDAAESVEKLREAGVQVAVMTGDVGEASDVSRIMTELRGTMPPLKGIFHAAGLLDDAMLPELDAERFERVMRPKIYGAWNLHRATVKDDLEMFVLFSSLTAITGSPGQANYAAANAALDGFARWRRSLGLAAVSINWGPWGEAGLAAQEGRGDRLTARGIRSISTAAGLQALAALLQTNPVEMAVADLDLPRLASFVPVTGSGLYAELFSKGGESEGDRGSTANSLDVLKLASQDDRPALMLQLIRELAARVMGQNDPDRIESDRPLQEQGFDSLMAVDLRNLIAKTFSVELPVSLLFDYPTPEKIVAFMLDEVLELSGGEIPSPAAPPVAAVTESTADDLVDEIEQLLMVGV